MKAIIFLVLTFLALSVVGQEKSIDGTKIVFVYKNVNEKFKVPIYFSNGVNKEFKAQHIIINKEKGVFSFYRSTMSYDDFSSPTDSVRVNVGEMTSTLRFICYDHSGVINIVICKDGDIIDSIMLNKK